jgi:multicomponent Na+:H+ antiporter subunit D
VLRPLLVAVAVAAIVLGVAISVVPGLGQRAEYAAARFQDRSGYAARVLRGHPFPAPPSLPVTIPHTSPESLLYGGGATVLAFALALVGLYRRRLPRVVSGVAGRLFAPPVQVLRELHSGVVGDYVAWITVGTAVVGGVWAVLLHG